MTTDLNAEFEAGTVASNGHGSGIGWERLAVVHLEEVEVQRVEWLWPGRIPYGKVTVLDGDPGLGKSTVTLDLAARVSTGSPLPTGERLDGPATVVMLSAEDGAEDTIKPRLLAAGGDERRVKIIDHVTDDQGPRPFEIPADLGDLRALILDVGARLVVVDPFMAFLSSQVKANQDQDVRRAMHPLKELAEQTGAAVVVVRHLNKSDGGNALYRGGGSIGIVGAARAGLLIAKSKEDPAVRVLAVSKNNLGPEAPSIGYRLENEEPYDVARVHWAGVVDQSAADLLARDDPETPDRQEAIDFLVEQLGRGPAKWETLAKLARDYEVSEATLRRARDMLQTRRRVGKRWNGKVGQPGAFVEWYLTSN